jgi:hypothetical protein
VTWTVINAVCLLAPFILLRGRAKYFQIPNRSGWRFHASFVGLSAPVLSVVLWVVALLLARGMGWHTSDSLVRHLIGVGGLWIPMLGMLVGLAGQRRLLWAIVPASLGTVLFWFGTTLP